MWRPADPDEGRSRRAPPTAATAPPIASERSARICLQDLDMTHRTARSSVPLLQTAAMLGILLLAAVRPLCGQEPGPIAPADTLQAAVPTDTAGLSARGAFLRSLILPGWGQAYVGAPGRGAIYFAMESGALWMALRSRQQLRAARVQESWLRETGELPARSESPLAQSRARQVEDWTTVSIFLLFLAGADAYVAAQLADFSEHVGVRPTIDGGLGVEASVPLGRRW